ncbi:MAG: 23S rRNA (pseudouridine(1915)-N(3))-methyltransferase RlmH [Rhizobiales bacterium]|nr:23S rRNA (pseudouridine(1915)-N(3))-methyltransferase RlmH [Hyphomicrobiales bacterium]MBI3674440.1 23S rRNA (pseudouridine(1915)-N(3))-methyltransferase RlmH [Hyphomicrobiales bacterium]
MKVAILAVGRLKPGPEKILAEDYQSRAAGLGQRAGITRLTVSERAESPAAAAAARQIEEARFFARHLPPRAFTVVLDERGKEFSSAALADFLRRHIDSGTADMAFLIGGPDGHAEETRKPAGLLLSLGPMTWPHRLVRVMLLEQIYRAVTIMVNHPYHRA